MLLAQFFCTFYPRLDIQRKFQLLIGGVVIGVLFAVAGFFYRTGELTDLYGQGNPILTFFRDFWTTSDKANLVLPLLFLGIVGLLVEFANVTLKEEKNLLRKSSQTMLHLSFLVILVGALLSANTSFTTTIEVDNSTRDMIIPGTSLSITIDGLVIPQVPGSSLHAVDYDTSFRLTSGNKIIGYGVSRLYVDHADRVGHEVTIIQNSLADIYIVTLDVDVDLDLRIFFRSLLQIRIIPYINVLWIGCFLLHFAFIPLTITRFILLRKTFSVEEAPSVEGLEETTKLEETVNNGGQVID